MLSHFSHVQLFATLWTVAHQAPLSMVFSRQGYWSGLPCPPPGDLPNPEIRPTSLMSPALAGGFFTTCSTWRVCLKFGKIEKGYLYKQTKTTMRYHLIPVRMAIIKKSKITNTRKGVEKMETTLQHWCQECKLVHPITAWRFIKKLKIVTVWSSNPTLGHILRKDKSSNLNRCIHPKTKTKYKKNNKY